MGRTPPCIDSIVAYGVKEVVFATLDPNPVVAANNTPERLRAHGIKVTHYPLPEIEDFYRSYIHWTLTKKPWVTVKLAQTLDGKIAGLNGRACRISNNSCFQFTHQKRKQSDVILTTSKTINIDNPSLNVRMNGEVENKVVAILDRKCMLKATSTIFNTAKLAQVYVGQSLFDYELPNHFISHLAPEKEGGFDLSWIVNHLGTLGYHDVWVEAGGILFNALHKLKLVNQTFIYIAPFNLGKESLSANIEPFLIMQK